LNEAPGHYKHIPTTAVNHNGVYNLVAANLNSSCDKPQLPMRLACYMQQPQQQTALREFAMNCISTFGAISHSLVELHQF